MLESSLVMINSYLLRNITCFLSWYSQLMTHSVWVATYRLELLDPILQRTRNLTVESTSLAGMTHPTPWTGRFLNGRRGMFSTFGIPITRNHEQ